MQLLSRQSKVRQKGSVAATLLPPAQVGVEECAHGVLDTVSPVIWFIRRHMREHRRGLSLAQFRTLSAVRRTPAMNLSHLAEHLGASLPTASRIVGGLVAKELIVRTGSTKDRRVLALALTPLGEEVFNGAWEAMHRDMEKQLAGLSGADLAAVSRGMEILRGLFGSAGLRP